MKRFAKILVVIVVVLLIVAAVYLRVMAHRAVPDYNDNIVLERLEHEVRVVRDGHAVPTIYAQTDQDLYRAVGYVMAQDRLWQMDLMRRASTGTLAELFGEDFVDTDLLLRSLQITQNSLKVMARTDPAIIRALEAFADGVNQFIEQNHHSLPPEFGILGYKPQKWEPVHSVNFTGFMAWQIGGQWSSELILHRLRDQLDVARVQELMPGADSTGAYVHPHFLLGDLHKSLLKPSQKLQQLGLEVFSGSNSWVVSGSRSTTGAPLFANDMHLLLFTPGIWYQMHQVVAGGLNVTGVVMPGQPFIIAGHNSHIAWGMTSVMVDDVDFYQETTHPEDPHQYLFQGQWRSMEVQRETIHVRRNKSVERPIRYTHRGPVVTDFHGNHHQAISMRWVGNNYGNELRSMYLLNRATNWQQFREALSTFRGIAQNVNYADIHGNIGMQTAAGIPLRPGNGLFVMQGTDSLNDWQGLVPFEELPVTFNPPEGYVISANNRPTPPGYPYYIGQWFEPPQRYNRIRQMIIGKQQLSVDDFRQMLGDRKSNMAEQMVPELLRILQQLPEPTPNEQHAIVLLQQWNMKYLPGLAQPLIFDKFLHLFVENLLASQLDPELYHDFLTSKVLARNLIEQVWDNPRSAWYAGDPAMAYTPLVHDTFRQTITWIEQQLGLNPRHWRWGKVHQLVLEHPVGTVALLNRLFHMNRGSYSPGGSFHTVCPFAFSPLEPFRILHGASHRHIYSTANWDESLSVIPTGTSGIPASKFYCDQTEMYVNNDYRHDLFSPDKVQKAGRFRMKLLPGR